MSAFESHAPEYGCGRGDRLRNYWRRRFKAYEVRNGAGSRCATKRTVRELAVTCRVVCGVRGLDVVRGDGCATDLQQKRRTARRHKSNRHISTKQQHDQQEAGH